MTLGCQPGAFLTVHFLDVVVPIVERGGEMRGGPARLAASDWPVIDQHDGSSGAREQICGRHAGNPGTHDAHVRPQILGKRLKLRYFGSVHPDGGRVT